MSLARLFRPRIVAPAELVSAFVVDADVPFVESEEKTVSCEEGGKRKEEEPKLFSTNSSETGRFRLRGFGSDCQVAPG